MLPFRFSSVITASISAIWPKIVRLKPSVSSVEKTTQIKDARIKKKSNLNVLIVKVHMLPITKGVQVFRQHVVDNQKSYASILKQNSAPSPQPRGDTFSFTADQLVKFVATVAIQIAQPQVCYTTAPKDAVDKKSSLCRRVSEAAKSQLGVSISGSTLFEAIGSLRALCSLPLKFLSSDPNLSVSLPLTRNHQSS